MPQLSVTPIAAHVHYDDNKQVWKLKASRQTKENGKYKEWEPLFEFAADLATILTLLMAFWNIANSGTITAPVGDLSALGAYMTGVYGDYTEDIGSPPESGATFDGTTLAGTEYDGSVAFDILTPGSDWGQTPIA